MLLDTKIALVTGGGTGIGKAIAGAMLAEGAKVIIIGRTESKLLQAQAELGSVVEIMVCDITIEPQVAKVYETIMSNHGKLDILINNAGTNVDNLSLRMKEEEWKKVVDINLTSTFLLSKYAIRKMLKNKFGRVVNITSVVGHTGNLGQSNYAASKAGIIGMSKSLAIEYAKKNITVNCVSPGFIESDLTMNIA